MVGGICIASVSADFGRMLNSKIFILEVLGDRFDFLFNRICRFILPYLVK